MARLLGLSRKLLQHCLQTQKLLLPYGRLVPTLVMMRLQEQRQVEFAQMDNQITYNEALIDERDQGIAEISQQIGEVNEIFQAGLSAML